MIRVLMFDLGGTLIDGDNYVFPYVTEALETIQEFRLNTGECLPVCLVSDYYMPTPDTTTLSIFQEYVSLLQDLNLLQFFEPAERHITLSTDAGINKPAPKIFETAVKRLGLKADLSECLFITENIDHIQACRELGMKTLYFSETDPEADFNDWSEAPLLIAKIVNPKGMSNLEAALRLRLSVEHDVELTSISERISNGIVRGHIKKWHPLPASVLSSRTPASPPPSVTLPTNAEIVLDDKWRILAVKSGDADKEQLDDAAHYIETLKKNKQISRKDGKLKPGETHRETINKKGEKRIKRERFSTI